MGLVVAIVWRSTLNNDGNPPAPCGLENAPTKCPIEQSAVTKKNFRLNPLGSKQAFLGGENALSLPKTFEKINHHPESTGPV